MSLKDSGNRWRGPWICGECFTTP
uniref:Uncharacterized protein n=1 Tax=Magnetococcus massalia (strain MO-1) TaxID=451514 RepID=A0A1S7LGX8_MAGMO|nr:protein of unknown function [Candidatus Magnetococcus massalia]